MSEGAGKKLEGVAKMAETLIKPVIGALVFAIPTVYVVRSFCRRNSLLGSLRVDKVFLSLTLRTAFQQDQNRSSDSREIPAASAEHDAVHLWRCK
jgi:hypothetical protein